MPDKNWPAWYSSPDGLETEIFHSADKVPTGWTTGAEKARVEKVEKVEKPKTKAEKVDLDL